ncbi:transposase [Lewinella aquimaris]|uniref:Transposase n=1 Tax=Neolewinella aquimaris TaxID=1835722 RepID=A0A840EA02_9BACT|nr:leucine zipper domain-containing protein [Neolewinella aquimaris]MBB4080773.1 transposase [Neolewinella aquimaris]
MNEKIAFINEVLEDRYTFSSLCEYYGISRQTGYAIMGRYHQQGYECLVERTSRPLHSPSRIAGDLEALILHWRDKYPKNTWGAKKIRPQLVSSFPLRTIPSLTTITNVLRRNGRIKPAKARRRPSEKHHPKYLAETCNDIWTVDYKGHFRLGNGKRCHPLTVCDAKSHYVLRIKGQYQERWMNVR